MFNYNRLQRVKLTLVLFVVLGLTLLSCDRDCPTKPIPEDKGYNFYIYQGGGEPSDYYRLYIWNSAVQAITDSFYIDSAAYQGNIEVTVDEKYLILASLAGINRTRIYELATMNVVKELPYAGGIEVSPNGKYIAIETSPLRFLNASTFEEILADTLIAVGGSFDSTGNRFYAIGGPGPNNHILRYELDSTVTRLPDIAWQGPGRIVRVEPVENGQKLFVHTILTPTDGAIMSYHVDTDTSAFIAYTGGALGTDIETTPDQKYVIFTDPFTALDNFSTLKVYFVDGANDAVIAITPYPTDSILFLNCEQIAISPDGETCTFSSYQAPWHGVITIDQHIFTDYWIIDTINYGTASSVACRKKSK